MAAVIDFSIVVPILNEEQTIPELLSRFDAVIRDVGGSWEVIYVNDGSTDRSLDVLIEQRSKYRYLRIVSLSRNFGHQAAVTAGLNSASGQVVMLMDGDLQDSPEALPRMINQLKEG